MIVPGLAPGLTPSGLISLSFGGTMQLSSRSGFELPFPEFTKSDASGQFELPEITSDRYFSLALSGPKSALNVRWFDDRHIGTQTKPAIGVGTISGTSLSATITYGGYVISIAGTIAGPSLAATITTTVDSTTEIHTCTVLNAAASVILDGSYYSSFGSDSNDGLTPITPKRTLPTPQDNGIYFIERRSIFNRDNDHIVDETKTFTVLDYGIGHYYVGNQCDVLTGWADATGGAWSNTFTAHVGIDTPNGGITQVIENGFPLSRQDSLAVCQANPGTYYAPTTISSTTPMSITVYVHPTDGGNPNTNGKVYEATVRETFLAGRGSSRFEGFYGRGSTTLSGSAIHRSLATDGTDYAISRNFVVSHGVYHNHYMASGLMENGLALFCQVQTAGGNLSHWVFHRGVNDTVPTNWTQNNCAIIESPYRSHSGNETGYDWHPSFGSLGTITINKAYAEHVGGFLFFPSGPTGTVIINDMLVERLTGPSIFLYNSWIVNRLRHYQLAPYWPGPKLLSNQTSMLFNNSLSVIGFGNNIGPSNTYDGYLTPFGGPDDATQTVVQLNNSTFINLNTTYNRRVSFYVGIPNTSYLKISYSINSCQFSGWTSDSIWGDVSPAGSHLIRLGSDYNAFDIPMAYTWMINNSVGMTFAQYQAGWYGTYSASDAHSTSKLTVWTGLKGRYPVPVQTTTNPGGFTQPFEDPQSYLGVLVTQAFEAAGRLPSDTYTNADAVTDILALTPKYWFDSYSGVITSGSNVTQWIDRVSGLTLTPQTGTVTYLAIDPLLEGAPSLVFDGASNLSGPDIALATSNTVSVVFVTPIDLATVGYWIVASVGTAATKGVAIYPRMANGQWGVYNSAEVTSGIALPKDSPLGLTALSTNFNDVVLRTNRIITGSLTTGLGYYPFGVNVGGTGAQRITGRVPCLIYFERVLSAADQSTLSKAVLQLYGTSL